MLNLLPDYNGHISAAEVNIYEYSCKINRPSYILKPEIKHFILPDKVVWSAKLNDVFATGDTPELAYQNFDKVWEQMQGDNT